MTTQLQIVDQERLKVSRYQIVNFCDRWKIIEFSLFGSVLREDFHPDSDIDILYQFAPNHGWSLFDIVHMREELEQMFGRKVDFVSKQSLQNPYRRYEILRTHQVIYRHE
ncbi:MAG: nucleotidyltransferase family protein [Symploca sp. SIO1B1]|nr:nucleotidyltransferase family protein [Symploca sp. SIO1C2]NES01107.1 nucleotidyltransferase family protein [Symploca sp. SIO1B1]